jgi:transportin-1
MKSTVYSETDIAILAGEDEDSTVPDRDEDIKPRHHKTKTHSVEQEDGEVSDDEDEDDEEIYMEWNLRKCSAASIDVLSNMFGDDILEFLLPSLNEHLFHTEWKYRESGILVLGAIAEGMTDLKWRIIF